MDLALLRRMAGLSPVETPAAPAASTVATITKSPDLNSLRKLAGIPAVVEKKDEEMAPEEEMGPEEMSAEEEMPAVVSKIAAKAEGMKGDELVALIKQVYDAGVADAMAEEESEEETTESVVTTQGVTEAARKDLVARKDAKQKAMMPAPAVEKSAALTASIGVSKEDDAGWMAVELAKAGLTVDMEEAMGIFYFNFKKKPDEAKARQLAKKLQIELA